VKSLAGYFYPLFQSNNQEVFGKFHAGSMTFGKIHHQHPKMIDKP
jgi:hypothetical protein